MGISANAYACFAEVDLEQCTCTTHLLIIVEMRRKINLCTQAVYAPLITMCYKFMFRLI